MGILGKTEGEKILKPAQKLSFWKFTFKPIKTFFIVFQALIHLFGPTKIRDIDNKT